MPMNQYIGFLQGLFDGLFIDIHDLQGFFGIISFAFLA